MGFSDVSFRRLKQSVSVRQVLEHFGIEIRHDKACCPFHADSNPSLWVNDSLAYCFACGRGWDVIDLAHDLLEQRGQDLTLKETAEWLAQLPQVEIKVRNKNVYKGPVSLELVEYFHACLQPEHRKILHTERLLTDETIDLFKIGWRPDWKAFSLPFWMGEAGKSEIETLQFRKTESSPDFLIQKFIGLVGHNKRSLIGSTLKDWAVLVFGTFDALLACQDGLPVKSPNGVDTYASKTAKKELIERLPVKKLYVLFDSTPSERKSAEKVIADLPMEIVTFEFPDAKDYGDFRLTHPKEDIYSLLGFNLW